MFQQRGDLGAVRRGFQAAGGGGGPVVFDAIGTETTVSVNGTPPLTYDFTTMTVGAALTGGALVLVTQTNNNETIISAQWDFGGTPQNMTEITSFVFGSGRKMHFWGLLNPTSGNKTLRVTYTSQVGAERINLVSFSGVNSTFGTAFPAASITTNGPSSATNISVNVPSASTHMVIAASSDDSGSPSITGITGTQIYQSNSGAVGLGCRYDTGAAATKTMTATYTGTGTIGIAGIDIAP